MMPATGEHDSSFATPNPVECRIFYVVVDVRSDIRRMCKKKDC